MDQIFDRSSKAPARPRLVMRYTPARAAIVLFRIARFSTQLETRPLVQTNGPHLPEIPEPEHAHT
jgi:hypothetical protein